MGMETITFECEVITPMFMAGADGATPELRPASIKGAMRFWWRAMHGHLSNEALRTTEGDIFGNTTKKSKFSIRIINPFPDVSSGSLLPHKSGSFAKGFSSTENNENQKCSILFSTNTTNTISIEFLKNLFILTIVLGGLGKRSRRGMGSLKIINIENIPTEIESINQLIKSISPLFSYTSPSNYPTIKSIEIGRENKSVTQIGSATHEVMSIEDTSENKSKYKATIGAGRPRFASPIYISILDNGKPIITTLNIISPNSKNVDMALQTILKSKLL